MIETRGSKYHIVYCIVSQCVSHGVRLLVLRAIHRQTGRRNQKFNWNMTFWSLNILILYWEFSFLSLIVDSILLNYYFN